MKTNSASALSDELFRRISAGDSAALEILYEQTHEALYGFALSVLKNAHDAEDAVHDCFIAVRNNADSYRSFGKPLAWLFTITRNLCLQQLRRKSKYTDFPEENKEEYLPDNKTLNPEDKAVLSACMSELSDSERQIVVLHAVSGLKHREIAGILDTPLSTVLSKYHRAIKRLRKTLQ